MPMPSISRVCAGTIPILAGSSDELSIGHTLVECPQHLVPSVDTKIGSMRPSLRVPQQDLFFKDAPLDTSHRSAARDGGRLFLLTYEDVDPRGGDHGDA